MGEIPHPGSAVLFLDGDAEQAEVPQLAPQIRRESVAAVDLVRPWRDLAGGEDLDRLAQHVQGFAQAEIQAGKAGKHLDVAGVHGRTDSDNTTDAILAHSGRSP